MKQKKEPELIQVEQSQRQNLLLLMAVSTLGMFSEKWSALLQSIEELALITKKKNQDILSQKYEVLFKNETIKTTGKGMITWVRQLVGMLQFYNSGLKAKTIDLEDVASNRFRKYKKVSVNLHNSFPILKDLQLKMLNLTNLKDTTIPTSHLNLATRSSKRLIDDDKKTDEDDDEEED